MSADAPRRDDSYPVEWTRDTAGIVLVGGTSRRLGRDKALLPVGGVAAVRRIVEALRPLVGELLLVGGTDRFSDLGARWIPDLHAGAGPLGGIISGLTAAGAPWSLVLACDTPLVSPALLACLLRRRGEHCDAVVPRHAGGVEPLVAAYAAQALGPLSEAFAAGERAPHRALERMNVEYLDEDVLRGADPDLDGLLNVNTEADVARLEAAWTKLTARRGDDKLMARQNV